MKKWSKALIVMLLTFFVPFTAFAEGTKGQDTAIKEQEEERAANEANGDSPDPYVTFEELINKWEIDGYPDNIGHVWYNNDSGKFMIGLVDADESVKEAIKTMVGSSKILEFESATYAYNDLLAVQEDISQEVSTQTGDIKNIYSVGTGLKTIDGEVTGFGESGHEFRVVVTVDQNVYDEYVEKYEGEYGDKVHVEEADSASTPVEDIAVEAQGSDGSVARQTKSNLWLYMSFITMLCLLGIFLIKRNRLVMVKQTANGGFVTESRSLRKKEVIFAIKESGVEPSDNVNNAILKEVEKK